MNISEFFYAGGYGWYLWGSFGMTILLMASEVVVVKNQRRTIIKRLSRMVRLNAAEVEE